MRDPQTDRVIKLFALYQAPQQIMKTLREEYKDNALSYAKVLSIRKKYRNEILKQRDNLEKDIAILDPYERWSYLQDIIDRALEPVLVKTKFTEKTTVDYKSALMALKQAQDMASVQGAVNEESDSQIREIIFSAFDELKKAHPSKEAKELIKQLKDSLGTEKVSQFESELLENE